jgi:hypothetical protein
VFIVFITAKFNATNLLPQSPTLFFCTWMH